MQSVSFFFFNDTATTEIYTLSLHDALPISKRTVLDGPFTEAKELIAGYTLIQVKSKEEAREWARRFPNPALDGKEGEIEVRQLFELDDFGPSEAVERFRKMDMA